VEVTASGRNPPVEIWGQNKAIDPTATKRGP
jgi:hypothetical protein